MSFRILSIDGGGIRGIIAARILQKLEQFLDRPIRDHFHLISGTSTGALIAAGLMVGRSPEQIVNLYLQRGGEIFPYQRWLTVQRLPLVLKYGFSAPKFSDEGLIRVVRSLGLDLPLGNVSPDAAGSTKLMIVSYDTVQRSPIFFKSWRHEKWYADVPLWKACVCSAAAPTYFPAQKLVIKNGSELQTLSMIDGGVGANNPVACAVAEAIRLLRTGNTQPQPAIPSMDRIIDEIRVLSIGTGELEEGWRWREVRGWGALQWAPRIVDLVMDAPNDIHRYIAKQIVTEAGIEHPQGYLRLQPDLDQKFGAIDNADPEYLNNLLTQTETYLETQTDRIKAFVSL